jgi:hypothetical protein
MTDHEERRPVREAIIKVALVSAPPLGPKFVKAATSRDPVQWFEAIADTASAVGTGIVLVWYSDRVKKREPQKEMEERVPDTRPREPDERGAQEERMLEETGREREV